jgi:hypothetical protein
MNWLVRVTKRGVASLTANVLTEWSGLEWPEEKEAKKRDPYWSSNITSNIIP